MLLKLFMFHPRKIC